MDKPTIKITEVTSPLGTTLQADLVIHIERFSLNETNELLIKSIKKDMVYQINDALYGEVGLLLSELRLKISSARLYDLNIDTCTTIDKIQELLFVEEAKNE